MIRFIGLALGLALAAGTAFAADAQSEADKRASLRTPFTGDLDGMKERHYIRMLVVPSRTQYFIDRGRQYGISAEFARELEKFLDKKLDDQNFRVAIIPVGRDKLLSELVAGRGDIAASNLTITPERLKTVDFGYPVANGVREVLVTHEAEPGATSVAWLSGRQVWVRQTSSYYASLVKQNEIFAKAKKKKIDIQTADEQLEDDDILEMVNAGVIPATVVDSHIAQFWGGVFPNVTVHDGVALRQEGEIAWAFRKNSPQLKVVVDEFARTHGKGTLFGNIVLKRYLKDNKWVKNPIAEAERKRFEQMAKFFRESGDKYDVPWLLLAAQGFQESGIDQSKRNPSGAVGIMQIKPTTAAGSPILIQGVDASAEKNIEAGAKYLRFIVDQYYKDEPMGRIDKGLFAIASYNAGPARITRLRKQTEEMGLDPNRWFGNVEVAVSEDIGRETVEYVSNIYKYYVAYSLLAEQGQAREAAKSKLAGDSAQ